MSRRFGLVGRVDSSDRSSLCIHFTTGRGTVNILDRAMVCRDETGPWPNDERSSDRHQVRTPSSPLLLALLSALHSLSPPSNLTLLSLIIARPFCSGPPRRLFRIAPTSGDISSGSKTGRQMSAIDHDRRARHIRRRRACEQQQGPVELRRVGDTAAGGCAGSSICPLRLRKKHGSYRCAHNRGRWH